MCGPMEELFERICQKCEAGIPYHEAVQFLLWVYCTLDVLPTELRGVRLSRQDLCGLLSRLGALGTIILEPPGPGGRTAFGADDVAQPGHWDTLIARLLRKELSLDQSFPTRIGRYV